MTEVRPDADLGRLTRERAAIKPPRRALKFIVPLVILAAFAAIFATSLKDVLAKTVDVTVIRPKHATEEAGAAASAGSVMLQAAGWVEPDPFPIRVPALATGVIKELLVRESDEVKAGDPVALLIDDEAKIALEKAESMVAEAQAEQARAELEQVYAQKTFDEALAVTENAAVTQAISEAKAAESRSRAATVAGGESDVRVAEEELAIQKKLAQADAAGHRAVELAEARVRSAKAALDALKAGAAVSTGEAAEAVARARRARRDLEIRLDDHLRVEAARRSNDFAKAKVRTAEAMCRDAALRLERMTVRSPAAGVVMERVAVQGMLMHVEDPDHEIVCLLFDPAHIRIRVDVSQADLPKVAVGQKTDIRSQVRREKPYRGEVVRIVHRADIQKVTLQVHVRVLDGDMLLRPEMLCNVFFLGEGGPSSAHAGHPSGGGLLVPARVVVDEKFVWTLDPDGGRARKRPVAVGPRSGEWILITQGLNVTDKVIDLGRDQVEDGTRVRAREGE